MKISRTAQEPMTWVDVYDCEGNLIDCEYIHSAIAGALRAHYERVGHIVHLRPETQQEASHAA